MSKRREEDDAAGIRSVAGVLLKKARSERAIV
jgi:hypothetical protein